MGGYGFFAVTFFCKKQDLQDFGIDGIFLFPKRKRNRNKPRSNSVRAQKELDLLRCAGASDLCRLPQIIQQFFRSGPLPKAALS
jgi:hypothetical protein